MGQARRKTGADLHLLLVGDGMSRAALAQFVREEDAGGYVTFYGSVPAKDIPRFTTLADALIVSLSDSPDLGLTVPGKVASYMAAGKPVLASMDGAGHDAVAEAGGLASPACDAGALAENLAALCALSPRRARRNGRAHQDLLRNALPAGADPAQAGDVYFERDGLRPPGPRAVRAKTRCCFERHCKNSCADPLL